MSDLFGNHIVGFPTKRLILFVLPLLNLYFTRAAAQEKVLLNINDVGTLLT